MAQYKAKPMWSINALAILNWRDNWETYISNLVTVSPWLDEYLDTNLVAGNEDAKAVVRLWYRMFWRLCKWEKLQPAPDGASMDKLIHVTKRLHGLKKIAFS